MNGPVSIDPSRLKEAKAAYQGALLQDRPGLVDGDGVSHAANPFDMAPDGSVSFNRWTAAANRRSAQDTFFNDTETKADGTTTTVRRPSWQAVPDQRVCGSPLFSNPADAPHPRHGRSAP